MAEQFRTTISAVFWTETTDEATAIADAANAALPADAQDDTLVTIEYKPDGPPQAAEPELDE